MYDPEHAADGGRTSREVILVGQHLMMDVQAWMAAGPQSIHQARHGPPAFRGHDEDPSFGSRIESFPVGLELKEDIPHGGVAGEIGPERCRDLEEGVEHEETGE